MKPSPYSAATLALGGIILMGMGAYFVFVRPPLLPEDLRSAAVSMSAMPTGTALRSISMVNARE